MDIFNLKQQIVSDTSVERYQVHEYEPVTGTNLNNPGEIRIVINQEDLYVQPSKSYLIIEGKLTKNDGTGYDNANMVSLINNGVAYLFKSVRYQLNGQDLEYINNPGHASTMMGLLTYPDDYGKSRGLNQLWSKDTTNAAAAANLGFAARQAYIIQKPDPKGIFSIKVNLRHLFGFADDYDKALYGIKHQLTLVRDTNDNAIFRDNGVDAGKVTLSKVSWWVPHVTPSLEMKNELNKVMESKARIPMIYRSRWCDSISVPQTTNFTWRLGSRGDTEKPRYIILGFQTNKGENQETNPAIFDHVNVKSVHAMLNSERYPEVDYDVDFTKMKFSRVYGDAASFCGDYYGINQLIAYPNVLPSEYKDLYPLFVLDVSKQSEALKNSVADIQVRVQFSENVAANTQAYALILSDKTMSLRSDGNNLRLE